ncbi:MAG TPA: hypothetical protein VK206_21110 [Anaerolineales bacterium]|nr:hypothetical protein [Anaerolineales bacterium]
MFENRIDPFQNTVPLDCRYSENIYTRQYNAALNRFRFMLFKGTISRLKRKILHRPQWLYDLNDLKRCLSLSGSCYAGIQVVRISSIIGSEGRTSDFDMDFHPLSETSRERWVNMAMAYLARLPLPPIELIQVGNAYFVRDGHHRISVSQAFGQIAMDAEVIAWKASPPFPWQADAQQERRPFLLNNINLSALLDQIL